MKKQILILCALLISVVSFAQKNYELTVFNKKNQEFTLFINGIKQNDDPSTEVTVHDLNLRKYNLMVIFKNSKFKSFQEEVKMPDESGEIVYKIKRKKRGDFFLKLYAQIPDEMKDFDHNSENQVDEVEAPEKIEVVEVIEVVEEDVCTSMDADEFDTAIASIKSKSFADTKKKVAKQIIDHNCFDTNQVLQMLELFTFESGKLEMAKYMYSKTSDQKNYYKINDVFSFSSSIESLQNYIKKQQ
ncbi:DUF4476 domain-containing protein [Aureivirga sp. CE67]|uniref:DUF4476 domain-containing protein n=1 Tax=Aureivirga sp. CE67 TaxID=1788983 RepID=UPI0018CA64D7|nr:DUF4476 domain-containing protein [Aureivirga sp. CE67]